MTPEQRIDLTRADDEPERRAIEDVTKFGIHILQVFNEDLSTPCFSYTVGLWHTHRHPEVILFGLKDDLCRSVLNDLNREIGKGRSFAAGSSAEQVLEGFRVYFETVPSEQYREYLGWNRWFYGGDEFEAVQMIWPNTLGVFPWQKEASPYLRWIEPILTNIPLLVS